MKRNLGSSMPSQESYWLVAWMHGLSLDLVPSAQLLAMVCVLIRKKDTPISHKAMASRNMCLLHVSCILV